MKAEFLTFKPSGKYYTSGEGVIPDEQWRGIDRNQIVEANGNVPGHAGRASDKFIVILPPDGVPVLLHPET